jgi:3',5'-cyclic AMP phosphodiesterase CpdA
MKTESGSYKPSMESIEEVASGAYSISVFISFAEKDKVMKDELRRSLAVLEAEQTITLWDRDDLLAGERSQEVICENLKRSQIVLLLISPDSMADDGLCKLEMSNAMKGLELGIVQVVPVRLRSVHMGNSPLLNLIWLPKRLVTQSADKDAAFTEIAEGIVKVCDRIKEMNTKFPNSQNNRDNSTGLLAAKSAFQPNKQTFQASSRQRDTSDRRFKEDRSDSLKTLASVASTSNQSGKSMNILHLSDLHFGDLSNARNWYSQLADDLKNKLSCANLDLLILSGDIANKSTEDEYEAAEGFVHSVSEEFNLNKKNVIIVPGNHDLNRDLSQEAYSLMRKGEYIGFNNGKPDESCSIYKGGDYIEVLDQEEYIQRFKNFSNFYQKIRGESYPLDVSQQALIYHFPELNLLVLGLNSSWQLDHHYKSRVSIHSEALSKALDQIRTSEIYRDCKKFVVWHHPIYSEKEDRIKSTGFMDRLVSSGFSVAFHGHIHKSEASQYRPDPVSGGAMTHIVCAGTFGALTRAWEPGYPLQYNYLKIQGNELTVETRCRRKVEGAWGPDSIWVTSPGQDPSPRYKISLPPIRESHARHETQELDTSSQNIQILAKKALSDHSEGKTKPFPGQNEQG